MKPFSARPAAAPTEPVRILTVGNLYPPHYLGGYELVWESAVRHLRAAGHEVGVLTSDFRLPGEATGAEAGDVARELRWYWRDHAFPPMSLRERLALERHNAAVFDRHLAELRPELVSWWAMGGMSLSLIERARRAGPASNAVVCDDWLIYGPKVDGWSRAFACRGPLARAAGALTGLPPATDLRRIGPVLFPSETTRRRAVDAVGLTDTEVCPQGVDRDLFRPAPPEPWRWRLLYAGRIDRRKGIELALLALLELPEEATLTIAGGGDGEHLAELRRTAAEAGLAERVEFTSRPRESLRELYANADALIFPVVWEEPWGLVPLEAMSVGRPVVATGAGGSGEYLVDGVNSLLFDPEDGPAAVADRVRRLAAGEALRERLRAGGTETSDRFSERAWNRAVEDLCERAAAGARLAG